MTDAELKIIMSEEGFSEVGEDISKTTKLLNELNGAINGLKRAGDAASYVDKLGASLADLNKNLYIDKYIQFNETLYKSGLTAGRSANNIKEYSEAMANLAKNVNTSTENMMKMFSQMQLTANFAKMSNGEMAGFYKKAQNAGMTDAETAKIIGQMNNYAAGPAQMAALASGDYSAIQDMAQKMMAAGDYEAAQNLLKMTDATNGGGMADRRPGKAKQEYESAAANKEVSIGAASRDFATNAYKFATFLENFLNKYSYLVAGGKQAGGAGDFMFGARNAIRQALGLGGGESGSGGAAGSSGGGSGGVFGSGLIGKIVSAVTFGFFSYTSKKSGDKSLVPGAPGTSDASLDPTSAAGNPMAIRQADKAEAERKMTWAKYYNDVIDKTADIMQSQGATEKALQTQRAKAIPFLIEQRNLTKQRLDLEIASPYGSAAEIDRLTNALNEQNKALIDRNRESLQYKLTIEQISALELNPARLALIKLTTESVSDTIKLNREMQAADKQILIGMEAAKKKDLEYLKSTGATAEDIANKTIEHNTKILGQKEKIKAVDVALATTYGTVGGMNTEWFRRAKETVSAIADIQTTLPTALGDLMNTRKELYGMATAERDAAYENYQLQLKTSTDAKVINDAKLDYLDKEKNRAVEQMKLYGSLTDQIQMALGELNDLSGGFDDTMPRIAEMGLQVRNTIGEAYAPMFKYGGYASEGATGQDIFTKTFSTMTKSTSFGLGAQGEKAIETRMNPADIEAIGKAVGANVQSFKLR